MAPWPGNDISSHRSSYDVTSLQRAPTDTSDATSDLPHRGTIGVIDDAATASSNFEVQKEPPLLVQRMTHPLVPTNTERVAHAA